MDDPPPTHSRPRHGRASVKGIARHLAALFVLLMVLPYVAEKLAGASTGPSAATLLQRAALTPAQVGSGYETREYPNYTALSVPTLDFCGGTFASERMRTDRLQLIYVNGAIRRGGPLGWAPVNRTPVISNELVHYRPGGASQAYAEALSVESRCHAAPQLISSRSKPRFLESVTPLVTRGGFPETVAFASDVTDTRGVVTRAYLAYQFDGDFLSAVYVRAVGSRRAAFKAFVTDVQNSARNLLKTVPRAR